MLHILHMIRRRAEGQPMRVFWPLLAVSATALLAGITLVSVR